MNLIVLLWIIIFVGAGTLFGWWINGWLGAVIGAFSGYLVLFLFGYFNEWLLKKDFEKFPGCRCGVNYSNLKGFYTDDEFGFLHICQSCGRRYDMYKRKYWSEVLPDGSSRLYKQRNFMRSSWKSVQTTDV